MKKRLFIMALSILLLTACGKDNTQKEENIDKAQTVEDVVGSVVKDKYEVQQSKGYVSITIQDKDVSEGTKSQMLKDSAKIFAGLSNIKGVKSPKIIWQSPLTDENGDEIMDAVLSVSFNEEDFKKVDWTNYSTLNIESIASEYNESKALNY